MLRIYRSRLHAHSVQSVTTGCAYTKIGNDTEKISKPLRKDDMLYREAFHIFSLLLLNIHYFETR